VNVARVKKYTSYFSFKTKKGALNDGMVCAWLRLMCTQQDSDAHEEDIAEDSLEAPESPPQV
jgi:hypothetical protein